MEPQRIHVERLALGLLGSFMKRALVFSLALVLPAAAVLMSSPAARSATRPAHPRRSPGPSVAADTNAPVAAAPTPYPHPADSKLTPEQEKRGWEIVVNSCLACHTADLLAQQRLTKTQWQASITKMRTWGSSIRKSEIDELAEYLASHFNPDTGPYHIATIPVSAVAAAMAPLPDGRWAHGDSLAGKALFAENCASCHGDDARGKEGTNLVDRPLLYRAPDFARVVRNGRGQMPAYEDTLSTTQVASLLAYLRTLPEP